MSARRTVDTHTAVIVRDEWWDIERRMPVAYERIVKVARDCGWTVHRSTHEDGLDEVAVVRVIGTAGHLGQAVFRAAGRGAFAGHLASAGLGRQRAVDLSRLLLYMSAHPALPARPAVTR